MDISKLLSQFATPAVLGKIAQLLGISESTAGKALAAAGPGVLAALLGVASKPQGAESLAANAARLGGGGLDGVLRQFGQDPGAAAELGSGLLSSVLGAGTLGALAGKLKSYAGLPEGAAGKLLGLVGGGTLGAIGQEAREKGLDAAGVARMLDEQRAAIAGAVPGDFAAALKETGLLPAVEAAPRPAPQPAAAAPRPAPQPAAAPPPRPAPAPAPKRAGWTRWLWVLVALVLLAWLLPRLFRSEPEPVVEEAPPPAETTAPEPETATPAPEPEPAEPEAAPEPETAAPAPEPEAPAATEAEPADPLVVGGVDLGATVTGALDSLTQTLSGVTDAASAQAALPQLTEVRDTLAGLESTVSALPEAGQTALQGLVASALPTLRTTAERLSGDSAIAGVIKPVLDDIIARLEAFAA
jgi:outer membrane biosynthesis protein TonB